MSKSLTQNIQISVKEIKQCNICSMQQTNRTAKLGELKSKNVNPHSLGVI